MRVSDFLVMVTVTGYSDYDGYLGSLDFDSYMDKKRNGRLPGQQGTVFDEYNNSATGFHYRTAATTTSTSCSSKRYTMPEDMRREYSRLPSSYNNHIGNLAADGVEAAMRRLREQQKYRLRTAAELNEETGKSQLERELALLNWEV
jgi:hypothetical protein